MKQVIKELPNTPYINFLISGSKIYCYQYDKIDILDIETLEQVNSIQIRNNINQLSTLNDMLFVAYDNTIDIIDLRTNQLLNTLEHLSDITDFILDDYTGILYSVTVEEHVIDEDDSVFIYHINTWKVDDNIWNYKFIRSVLFDEKPISLVLC